MSCERCKKLEAEISQLRDELRDMRALLSSAPTVFSVPLTKTEARIASLLLLRAPNCLTIEMIYSDLYNLTVENPPEQKVITIFMHKVRRKLAPHNIVVETVWGRGYRLTEENATRLRNLIIHEKDYLHA